jgi:hypothetical protein
LHQEVELMTLKEWLNESSGAKLDEAEAARRATVPQPIVTPFDPLTQVSADAKYIVRSLVLWFLVLPAVLGLLLWAVTTAAR